MKLRTAALLTSYNFRRGILARWKMYIPAVLIFFILWLSTYLSFGCQASFADYILCCFRGVETRIGGRIIIPLHWVSIFTGALYSSLSYTGINVNEYSIQLITRSRSRGTWWLSMCIWCGLSTLFYFAVAYGVLVLLCLCSGIDISLINTPEFAEMSLSSGAFSAYEPLSTIEVIEIGIFLPVFFSVFLNLLQLTLSLFISPSRSFLACIVLLILSCYYTTPALPGNFAIVKRSSYIVTGGLEFELGCEVIILLIMLIVCIGHIKIRQLDFLQKAQERV